MSLSLVLSVAAMIFFGLATFGVGARFNLVAAGLFCLTLAAAVTGGVPHL